MSLSPGERGLIFSSAAVFWDDRERRMGALPPHYGRTETITKGLLMKRLASLLPAISLLVSLLLLAGGQTAFAASGKTTAAPQPQQTILWLNDHGQVVRTGTGT